MSNADQPTYERERKFIVADKTILKGASWELIEQGYVWAKDGFAIRARVVLDPVREGGELTYVDKLARITAKGPNYGDEREEYEMSVHLPFARDIIKLTDQIIRKRRYHIVDQDSEQTWDIDEFLGDNEGLIVAELEGAKGAGLEELDSVRATKMPKWAYREVTGDSRFNNENLAANPVSKWKEEGDWKPESPWDWD
ncbi:hypothetical protein [Mycolicibacterium wolinskyi]|uniref:hypothetical protein n=1 Tax=Mycolicibacterium wolinskyi TaxID=59750 RepID=UPI003BAA8D9E